MSYSTEQWPPDPTEARPWHKRLLRLHTEQGRRTAVTVREVLLWGREVLIDESHRVYCPDCWTFVAAERLASPFNGHSVGLRRRSGVVAPPPSWEDEPIRTRGPDAPPESW